MQEEARSTVKGTVTLRDLCELRIDGVHHIREFDEQGVILEAGIGAVAVSGEGLKIENLSKSDGTVLITGQIEALEFARSGGGKRRRFGNGK